MERPWARTAPEPRSSPAEGSSGRRRSPGHGPTTDRARSRPGMTGNSLRPFGISPLVIAAIICSVFQPPRPVSLSGVRLPPTKTPTPGIAESDLGAREGACQVRLAEKGPGRMTTVAAGRSTRYLPRPIWVSAAGGRGRAKNHSGKEQWERRRFACSAPLMKSPGHTQ